MSAKAMSTTAGENDDDQRKRRMPVGKFFLFLSVPGIIRLLEIFLSALHIGCFGYFATFYIEEHEVKLTVAPFFLATTRETFFILVNFHSFLTIFLIILSSVISTRSHAAIMETLYLFTFDFLQFLLMLAASIGLVLLYEETEAAKVLGSSLSIRQGFSVTGIILGLLHLIGSIYDLAIYVRRLEKKTVVVT